ncbi:MAG: sigma-54-dependent Fis family transcriptional regulator [Planctomycetes bacterium]|nr:sigma-54-dependent Fis family transcriptional regulator [Planctomycetota bacterium]
MTGQILVVDDDPIECKSLSEFLRLEGYSVDSAEGGAQAIEKMQNKPFQVVLTDVNMPDVTGFDVLKHAAENCPDLSVVLITGYGQIEAAVEAIKLGAFDYITKPLIDEGVKLAIDRALGRQQLLRENLELRKQLGLRNQYSMLLGRDHSMQKIYDIIDVVANTKATVLITGESGTGKSLIAHTVHQKSTRRDQPFIEVSCGALPETLLESELFGHVRGAFTGAHADKPGKFELADGGTIFLDEISAASPSLQVKLLRILQDRTFEKIGSNDSIATDVRIIIASNKDLNQEIEAGNFRADLYYRINVVPIEVPPLRERVCDVAKLAEHFTIMCSRENNKNINGITDEAMRRLQQHNWPGNVRELENVIERAVILAKANTIGIDDLPPRITDNTATSPQEAGVLPLKQALEGPEREIIERALRAAGWNRQKAAEMLQVNRSTLFKKMRKYEFSVSRGMETD